MENIKEYQKSLYQPNFLIHGPIPQGMFCNNMTTQIERYRQVLHPLLEMKNSNFTICDLGSGLCDLHEYLNEININHQYFGIEIVPEMNAFASKKYKDITLFDVDFLDADFQQKFDFFVLSGTLNLKGEIAHEEWENYVFEVIEKMFHLANIGISFNLLTSYSTFTKPELFYIAPEKIISFVQQKLSRFCAISTNYPLYEFTVTVLKKEAVKQKYQHEDFIKYF